MNDYFNKCLVFSALFSIAMFVHSAAKPVFSLSLQTPNTITTLPLGKVSVLYKITNNSKLTRNLMLFPSESGISQQTDVSGLCSTPTFSLRSQESCTLNLTFDHTQFSSSGSNIYPQVCKTKSPQNNEIDPFLCSRPAESDGIKINYSSGSGVKCWGNNNYGQLGIGSAGANKETPQDVQLPSGILQVETGLEFSCALLDTGAVKCWGRNNRGQLGTTNNLGSSNPLPQDVEGLQSGVKMIGVGYDFACALLETGAMKCWGHNNKGQLGNTQNSGTSNPNPTPLDVTSLPSAVQSISLGHFHTCVKLLSGQAMCWGYNSTGQLGNPTNSGTVNPNPTPLYVQSLPQSGIAQVCGGGYYSCALLESGEVKCWGTNLKGELGGSYNLGTTAATPEPKKVYSLDKGVAALHCGYRSSCVILNDKTVKCWGLNENGQLGNSTAYGSYTYIPQNVPVSNVATLSGGYKYKCALLNNGTQKCWGDNSTLQLGVTGIPNSYNPVDISNISDTILSPANYSSCAGYISCAIL